MHPKIFFVVVFLTFGVLFSLATPLSVAAADKDVCNCAWMEGAETEPLNLAFPFGSSGNLSLGGDFNAPYSYQTADDCINSIAKAFEQGVDAEKITSYKCIQGTCPEADYDKCVNSDECGTCQMTKMKQGQKVAASCQEDFAKAIGTVDCNEEANKEKCKSICAAFNGCELQADGTCAEVAGGSAGAPGDVQSQYWQKKYPTPEGYKGALPPCAFSGTCRSTNDLLQLLVNFANGLLVIIGSFAFAFFIYGGFTIITSFGNPERTRKGYQIILAAVVGMAISLSAYILVEFLLDAVGVSPLYDFRNY
ncbi:MAG TPA: pilin [Patescibacteria group bacterium]|nr:pilin [Patescibacteria group bacterium]